jgi:hypothetical protein
MKNKKQQGIYAIPNKVKSLYLKFISWALHIYPSVGGQFKKRQTLTKYGHLDWEKKPNWIKLKIMMKKYLLDFWRKIGDKILFEFYTQIYVKDKFSFYEFSFPLVIKDENIEHASQVIKIICDDLFRDYKFASVNFTIPQVVTDKNFITEKINEFYFGVEPTMVGEIEFNIYHGINVKPQNIEFIINDKNLINELRTYKFIDKQFINYKTIKYSDNYLPPLEKFLVKIILIESEISPPNLTKEEQIDRMNYLLNYKPKK